MPPGAPPTMSGEQENDGAQHGMREGEGGHTEEGNRVGNIVDRRFENLDDALHDECEQPVLEERAVAGDEVNDELPEEQGEQRYGDGDHVREREVAAKEDTDRDEKHVPEEHRAGEPRLREDCRSANRPCGGC